MTLIIGTLNDILQFMGEQLLSAVTTLSGSISVLIGLRLSDTNAVVSAVWILLRNACNIAFLVALIAMAFATIFQVSFPVLRPYAAQRAFKYFLIAAIMLNFSMAVGQVVLRTADAANQLVIGILPKDLGNTFGAQLRPDQIENNPPIVEKGLLETLKDPAAREQIQKCVNSAAGAAAPSLADLAGPVAGTVWRGLNGTAVKAVVSCYSAYEKVDPKAATELAKEGARFATLLMRALMLLAIFTCLLVVEVFLVIRIPYVWILLAMSPLAWTAYAFPGGRGQLKEWWRQFLGWNIFSPVYLLVLYLGLVFLNTANQGEFLRGLPLTSASSVIGVFIFYGIALTVFIGGAAAAVKLSFIGGTAGTTAAAKAAAIAKWFGVTETERGGALAWTGIPEWGIAAQRAMEARAKQTQEALAGKLPQALRTMPLAEKEAALQKLLGVRGGAIKAEQLLGGRVAKARSTIEQDMRERGMLTEDQRKLYTQTLINDRNPDTALAAREIRIQNGWADITEMESTLGRYRDGSLARQEFRGRAGVNLLSKPPKGLYDSRDGINRAMNIVLPEKRGDILKAAAKVNPEEILQMKIDEEKKKSGGAITPDKEKELRTNTYEQLLEDGKLLGKLGKNYLDPATPYGQALKKAIQDAEWDAASTGKLNNEQRKERERYIANAKKSAPTKHAEIDALFT